jgi:hypothetical protein
MSERRQKFDRDLREGLAREDAFIHTLLRSRVEHKRDKKAARTGNVALEVAQLCRDGVIRLSGVMIESDRWAHEYAPECWLILPTEAARAIAMHAAQRFGGCWIGDDGAAFNILVPIEWLVSRKHMTGETER